MSISCPFYCNVKDSLLHSIHSMMHFFSGEFFTKFAIVFINPAALQNVSFLLFSKLLCRDNGTRIYSHGNRRNAVYVHFFRPFVCYIDRVKGRTSRRDMSSTRFFIVEIMRPLKPPRFRTKVSRTKGSTGRRMTLYIYYFAHYMSRPRIP